MAVSIVTPPGATKGVLREARRLGIKRVWMQPGSWDKACLDVVGEESGEGSFEVVIYGGEEEGEMSEGEQEGWCLLVHGEEGLRRAGRWSGGNPKKGREEREGGNSSL